MKLLAPLISGCILLEGILSLPPSPVRLPTHPPMAAQAVPLARVTTTPVLYPRTLKGLAVRTPDGMLLGRVEDLALDPADARIAMVIVVTGGRFGLGNRFIALPWSLVQPAADGTALIVASAPMPLQAPPNQERSESVELGLIPDQSPPTP